MLYGTGHSVQADHGDPVGWFSSRPPPEVEHYDKVSHNPFSGGGPLVFSLFKKRTHTLSVNK